MKQTEHKRHYPSGAVTVVNRGIRNLKTNAKRAKKKIEGIPMTFVNDKKMLQHALDSKSFKEKKKVVNFYDEKKEIPKIMKSPEYIDYTLAGLYHSVDEVGGANVFSSEPISRKVFDMGSEEGISQAEKYQQQLYKKYNKVNVEPVGLNKVAVTGSRK